MKQLWVLVGLLVLAGCKTMEGAMPWIDAGNQMAKNAGYDTDSKLAAGIKEALITGTDRASTQLSQTGAFNLKLPAAAQPVADTLRQFGFGSYVDKVETAMNRGAEQAVAEAAPVFKQAISNRDVIWLHAVSVGEVNICVQLIKVLQPRLPNLKLVVSTTTTTGRPLLHRVQEHPQSWL